MVQTLYLKMQKSPICLLLFILINVNTFEYFECV